MIVNCPACGTPASIEPNFFGKKLRCANQECRQMFRVQSDGTVQLDMNRPGAPQTFDWQNPPAQEAQTGDWLAAPPPRPGEQPMAAIVNQSGQMPMAQVIPMGSMAGGDDEESSYTPGDYGYGNKKKNKFLVVLIFLVVLLIGAGGFGYWLVMQNVKTAMAKLKEQYKDSLDKKHWKEVVEKGKAFLEKTKDNAEIKETELAIAWGQLQQQIEPSQLTSKEKIRNAISELMTFYRVNRQDPNFSPFRKDFTETSYQLVKTGATFLETNPDSNLHDAMQPLLDTAREAGSDLSDKDQVKQWADDAQTKYVAARTAIDASLAKANWMGRLQDVLAKENLGQIDSLQSEHQDLVKKHPLLQTDNDLTSKLENLKQVEPAWVKYTSSNSAPIANKPTFGPSIRICPPVKTPDGVQDDKNIVLAMTRGTLYGLSARTGKDRWALRVGQDVRELPPRVSLGGEAPDLAFVVTTEDAGQNYLSQMNLLTGERNWTRKLPSPCPGGPLLISNNRLVVPLKETIAIVEAGTGKMSGFYTISGYDISSQPAHDKARDRLFVPVDRGRIFVIDLTGRKCVSVIYTEHGSGQMKGAPLIVDNLMVACIATGSGAGSTRIRAYDISAKGQSPTFDLIGTHDMPGHASTTPYVDGNETLGIVSDQGLLWLFGIGKSSTIATSQSKGATPFYPLTPKPMGLKLQVNTELKKDQPRPRVQVAHVALNDWWVFSHEHLIRNVYDPFRSVLLPSPVGSLPLGTPLHRAEITPDGKLIVLVTQTKGQAQMLASGIDLTTGAIVWQTQLGTEASQDPVALADAVAMLDRGGAVFTLKSSDIPTLSNWQQVGSWPALPLAAASHSLLKTLTGQTLVSMSFDPVRARIILRKIDLSGSGSMIKKEFPHTFAPIGTSVVLDDGSALIPCKDGNIYRFNFTDGTSQSLFSWRDPVALTNAIGHLLMPTANQFFATNGMNKVLRWDRTPQGIWKKSTNDFEIPARIVTNLAAVAGNRIVVGDEAGNLHGLALASLGTSKQWNLKGAITKGPFRLGAEGVGCVVDGKKLWWINSVEDEDGKFYTDPAIASIIGDGVTIGDDILLAVLKKDPATGMLASYLWIDMASGKLVQAEKLPEGLAPSSGPTVLGKNWAFAPLSDGTVRILVKPAATTAANP